MQVPLPPTERAEQISTVAEDDRSQRLTRADWLDLALETLVSDGIDRVKIQIMAKHLGVARSSFYWHFESTESLHRAMLDEWLQKNTGPIIERAMRPANDINWAVISVFECWFDASLFNPSLDIAVRLWGRRSPLVRSVVVQADTMRVDALRQMFMRYDFAPKEALVRARVIYFTQIGQYTLDNDEAAEVRFSLGPEYLHSFTGIAPDAAQKEDLNARIRQHYPGLKLS